MAFINIALTTFWLVFLAELGDKTQLATMTMAGKSGQFWAVFIGSALALVASSLLGALLGAQLSRLLPEWIIKTLAGASFIIIGILMLTKAMK